MASDNSDSRNLNPERDTGLRRIDPPVPPGSDKARALGCLCSRSQNRAGGGGCGPGGMQKFFPLPWCPVHREVEVGLPGVITFRFSTSDEPPAA